MLKIKAIKLEINTTDGLYGTTIPFTNGLNIIRGNNTTGKSTIFQSILYALGFEELLGGKNEKTMQSVLKDEVIGDDARKHKVLQSFVILEIENKTCVTIRRSVVSETRKSILIDVIYGPYITHPNGKYEIKQMYVHDRGSASDELHGFHRFLEEFLGWDLPEVITSSGDFVKLYLPLVAPSFIIEQKTGWSTFFATQPYYSIKNAEGRVVEFLLNLDVFQNEKRKQIVLSDKRVIEEKWSFIFNSFKKIAERSGSELIGLTDYPSIINNIGDIYLRSWRNEQMVLLPDLIQKLSEEFLILEDEKLNSSGINIEKSQRRLSSLTESLNRYSFRLEQLTNETFYEKEKLKQYILQRGNVEEDLKNNKGALKMYNIGANLPTSLANLSCPTCGNKINDSLLPREANQQPMQIEENISFLDAQKKMIDVFIQTQRKKNIENETKIADLQNETNYIRQQIRSLKKDLISDDRLPSEALIEQKLTLKKQIEFYTSIIDTVESLKEQIKSLSNLWEKVLATEKNLPKDFFSSLDRRKLNALETNLIQLLSKFSYSSKENDSIKISSEKYLPVIEVPLGNGKSKSYDIRFDSSGSDLIRCLWAYYIALLKTSIEYDGCHPNLLIFDEPQQQSASTKDFHDFLEVLSSYTNSQILVFASFQNSDEDYAKATEGLKFNLIKNNGLILKKIKY